MAIDFKSLKSRSKSSFEKLNSEMEKLAQKGGGRDAREWQPTVDKAGNGSAVIRFLPPAGEEDVPFVRLWTHGFQGPGGWLIENSLTTKGEACPVCEYNSELWNAGQKAIVRKQKRKVVFISNIYVVKDTAAPENEGKVFLFKYGVKISDMLKACAQPDEEDKEAKPFNPFDLWSGANFMMKIGMVKGGDEGKSYRNYDKSKFATPGPLFDGKGADDKMETVWKQEYILQPFLAADQFKGYDELKARLNKVIKKTTVVLPGGPIKTPQDNNAVNPDHNPVDRDEPSTEADGENSGGDEDLQFFQNLGK